MSGLTSGLTSGDPTSRTRVLCARPLAVTGAALVLAGLAAGALAPTLAGQAPWAPAAALGLLLTLAGWLARGGVEPLPARLAVGAGGGALAGLLLQAPAGLAHATLGLALGLALAPARRRSSDGDGGESPALLEALPVAAGALLGGVLAGGLASLPALVALGSSAPEAAGALLAGAVALGVAAGEAARHLILVQAAPPAWIAALSRACEVEAPAAHAVLAAAIGAHREAALALDDARLDAGARRDAALLARDLLAATARAAVEARRWTQATRALSRPPALESHGEAPGELEQARARIGASLDGRRDVALEEAGRHASALARLAASLVERGAADRARPLDALSLERRAAALERRVEPTPGGAA